MTGLLTYLDEQIESLNLHLPAAVESFDAKGIHQARVATRRLKAGLDLVAPLIQGPSIKLVNRAGRRIRRRLGPLRDLDVMIEHLATMKLPAKLQPATAWVSDRLEKQRRDARVKDYENGKRPAKHLDQLDEWWRARHKLEAEAEGFDPLVREALHAGFADFKEQADWVSGVAAPPEEAGPVDVHQLRIAGKGLRYTFELADAHGLDVPKGILKKFKAMQESLGDWHDFVVLVETALSEFTMHELPLHSPDLAAEVLDLSKLFVQSANRALARFKTQWKTDGEALAAALHEVAPLTMDARDGMTTPGIEPEPLPIPVEQDLSDEPAGESLSEHGTGRDPAQTPETQAPPAAGGGPEGSPGA